MSYAPMRGYDGKVEQGATPTALLGVESWEADVDVEVNKVGPFLNDSGTIYKIRGGIDCKGKVKCSVPDGMDANQTALIDALTGGDDIKLVLTQGVQGSGTGGYVLTIDKAIISKVKPSQDTKGGPAVEFEFEANGAVTLA